MLHMFWCDTVLVRVLAKGLYLYVSRKTVYYQTAAWVGLVPSTYSTVF